MASKETPAEGTVVTLVATAGNKPGECVGSYQRHIVFLPRETEDSETYRVKLIYASKDASGLPKKDRNGRPLFRGVPTPVEESFLWKDNGDGTITRTRVLTDWKCVERTQALETRAKARSFGEPYASGGFEVVLADRRADAVIVEIDRISRTVIEEYISSRGELSHSHVDTRVEQETRVEHPLQGFEADHGWPSNWKEALLASPARLPPTDRTVSVAFKLPLGGEKRVTQTFAQYPAWMREELLAPYPPCACGLLRVDTEEGKTLCHVCEKTAKRLARIEEGLPSEMRVREARIARLCVEAHEAGRAWEGEAGEAIVHALPGSEDVWDGRGYPWYYATDEGFYASRFPPVAMRLLGMLDAAQGDGLVLFAAWLPDDASAHKADRAAHDLYARTQERGESVELDPTPRAQSCVAVFLRESVEAREERLAAHARLVEVSHPDVRPAYTSSATATFVEKSPRQFLCHACGRISKMEQTEWNRYRNTGSALMVCERCGAHGEVRKDASPAAPPRHPAPSPRTGKSAAPVDLSGLLGKFGRS